VRTRAISGIVAAAAVVIAALPIQRTSAQPDAALPRKATLPTALPSPLYPAVPSVAPGYKAPRARPSPPEIAGVVQRPFVGISLQDAVSMSLLKNPNLAVSAADVRIARYRIVEAKGAFDVQLRLEPSSSFSVTPPENVFLSGPGSVGIATCFNSFTGMTYSCPTSGPGNIIQHQSSFQYGITGQTINGTTYAAGITQTRTFNNTIINAFNPYYQASLNLSVTQPLLKNFGLNSAKRDLKLSVINADVNAAQALVDASDTISQVENAYWDLTAAWRNVAIQEDALKEAVEQQQSNVRLARRGAAAPIDAVESQTQVSNFQDNVFVALQDVSELQNELKSLIVADPNDPIWKANLVPSSPALQLPSAGDLSTIIAQAQLYRPEVRRARDEQQQADLDRAYAKNQSLPEADIVASYMSNGFAGLLAPLPNFETTACTNHAVPACPTPPPETQGTMAFAYHNLWAGTYPAFNIAFVVSFPLQNSLARGLRGAANEEERQSAINTQGVAARIGYEARNALQSYQSALSRLYAASQSRAAAEQVYASEVRKFHRGASTTFLVLQRQVQLEQARGRELQAQTDLNKAVVELERVQGTILTDNGVNLRTLGSKALAP
jgi:HAE1 family hydrophobic/amphiphilic exporter-1